MNYLISLLLGLFLTGCSSPDSASRQEQIREAAVAPAVADEEVDIISIELLDLEGKPISWEKFKGKKVFLNFWATWCKPCILEMPSMSKAAQQLGEEYVFLAASYEDLDKIRKFTEKRDFDFQFVHTKTPIESLNIYSLPTTFLINSQSELVETVIGCQEWNEPEPMNQLKSLD